LPAYLLTYCYVDVNSSGTATVGVVGVQTLPEIQVGVSDIFKI